MSDNFNDDDDMSEAEARARYKEDMEAFRQFEAGHRNQQQLENFVCHLSTGQFIHKLTGDMWAGPDGGQKITTRRSEL